MDENLQQAVASIRFPMLTTERYFNAVATAKEALKKHIAPPNIEQFKSTASAAYPAWFSRSIIAALFVVMASSFFISSGKQVAAFGLVFDHLPDRFNHLSALWSNLSIVFMLLMSEVGAVLFLVASGTIGEVAPAVNLFGRSINLTKWVFRLFALLCAGYAIASNVSITMLDPVANVSFIQWMASIGIPLTVLGLSMLLERIVIEALKAGTEQKLRYEKAIAVYQATLDDPTKHELYPRYLSDALYAELVRYKADREKLTAIQPYLDNDPDAKKWLVASEYQAHKNADALSLESLPQRFLPAA
jgi:hypothetical protein